MGHGRKPDARTGEALRAPWRPAPLHLCPHWLGSARRVELLVTCRCPPGFPGSSPPLFVRDRITGLTSGPISGPAQSEGTSPGTSSAKPRASVASGPNP